MSCGITCNTCLETAVTDEPCAHRQPEPRRFGHAVSVGRVGALAVLLGIGTAAAIITAGAATADTSGNDSSSSSATRSSASSAARSSASSSAPSARGPQRSSPVVSKPAVQPAAARASGGIPITSLGAGIPTRTTTSAIKEITSIPPAVTPTAPVTATSSFQAPAAPALGLAAATVASGTSSSNQSTVPPAPAAARKTASAQPSSTVTPPAVPAPAFFPNAEWLWKPIAANPVVAANSATWVSYLAAPNGKRIANMYNYGVTIVPASAITTSTPRYSVKLTKTGAWGKSPFGSFTVPLPKGTRVPPGSDGHVVVLDPVSGQAFGIWQAKYNKRTNTWSGSWGGRTPINGNGIDQAGSATAAGISRAAGVVTAAELTAAIAANTGVNHALVFSTDIAGPGFVGPAIKSDGKNIAAVATPIPEGYRIQLDPSINIDAIPNITPGEKVIAKTLQTHGAYVVDQGGARMAFTFETVPDATATNPGAVYTKAGFTWDYYDMTNIPWTQLRVLAA